MQRLPLERARQEIDDGIASVTAALGDGTAPAPFFRIPGLLRADGDRGICWPRRASRSGAPISRPTTGATSPPQRVYDLAIQRLEAKGKGILLLHDIQPRTVAALPRILHELKARGYRIVHVVPATPERPATPTEPQQWQLHPPSETVAISRWPKIPNFVFAGTAALPAPALSDLDWRTTDRRRTRGASRGVPLPPHAVAAANGVAAEPSAAVALPVPAASIFKIPESTRVTMLASLTARRGTDGRRRRVQRKSRRKAGSGPGRQVTTASRAPQPRVRQT